MNCTLFLSQFGKGDLYNLSAGRPSFAGINSRTSKTYYIFIVTP